MRSDFFVVAALAAITAGAAVSNKKLSAGK